ncbi:MAG: hypothetical protein KDC98_13630 [Planctomycetes bacterium]|nr:hypothetical protein [Planctomycetota bacterium]
MNKIILLPFLALTSLAPLAAQDTEHDLRLVAKPGTSVWIDQLTTQTQEIDLGGQTMESGNKMHLIVSFTVKEVTDSGSTVVEAKFERVSGAITIPMMGDQEFDSADLDGEEVEDAPVDIGGAFGGGMPDIEAVGRAAASMAGMSVIARLGAHGSIESMDASAIEAKLEKKAGEMGSQMLKPYFSEDGIKGLFEATLGARPKKPMAVGGTWTPEENEARRGGPKTVLQMTLTAVGDKTFEVSGSGTIEKGEAKTPAEDESEEEKMMREMQAKAKIKNGKIKGHSIVSREDGFVTESKNEMSFDMSTDSPFGGEMTVTQKSVVVLKRTTRERAMPAAKKESEEKKDGDR